MRNLRQNLASALRALADNWLRSALTTLGIVIGVGSVVLLVSIGFGVEQDVSRQVEGLGANAAFILPGKLDASGTPNPMSMMGISTLTEADARALAAVPGVARSVPISFIYGTVKRGKESYSAFVLASEAGIFRIFKRQLSAGKLYGPGDENQRVCVLSAAPAESIFGSASPVGQSILIRGVPFRVVGVLAKEETSMFGPASFAGVIYIPYAAARTAFPGGQVNRIAIETDLHASPDRVLKEVRQTLLRTHHGEEDFGVLSQKQLLNSIFRVFAIVESLLVGITSISLIVSGIGIMNIMLVTVTERTREIGIRKAVGARRRDIFAQFLIEAMVLCLTGGAIGVLLAASICALVSRLTALHPIITPGIILLAFGVCVAVGVIFGVAPAVRASRQDPIEALRRE